MPTDLTSFDLERAASLLLQMSVAGKLPHSVAVQAADVLLDEANTEEAQERFERQCRRLSGITRIPVTVIHEELPK
jgi:hypothetical protein